MVAICDLSITTVFDSDLFSSAKEATENTGSVLFRGQYRFGRYSSMPAQRKPLSTQACKCTINSD